MRLILVRHGRTASNAGALLDTAVPGAPLDPDGVIQAASLVDRLAHHPIDAVFASNLVRAQQTAMPIAQARGLGLTVLPQLREIAAGEDEMSADFTRYFQTLVRWAGGEAHLRTPGGESGLEFFSRFDSGIDQVVSSGAEVAMAVSHGAALRVWAFERVNGLAEAMGHHHLDNTGFIVAEGAPKTGWELAELVGVRSFE